MAKVPFNKLNPKVKPEIVPVQIGDQTIGVLQYLGAEEKLQLIGRVLEQAHEIGSNFSNPVKSDIYTVLEVIQAYTNIAFTDKQKEDTAGLYDAVILSGVWEAVASAIPPIELNIINNGIEKTAKAFYKYRNSVLGILEAISDNYEDLNLDLDAVRAKLDDPNTLTFVKDLLSKVN